MTIVKKISASLLLVFVTFSVLFVTRAEPQQQGIAFVNVNVVPFDRERVLPAQTVIVRDGRIAEIGTAETYFYQEVAPLRFWPEPKLAQGMQ